MAIEQGEVLVAGMKAGGGRAFAYQFAYESPVFGENLGAAHGLDEAFVWGVTDPAQVPYVQDDPGTRRIASEMTDALFRFAAPGNPGWSAYSAREKNTRVFGAEKEIESLYTNGPAGGGGIETSVRDTVVLMSTLVPRDLIEPNVEVLE
ncbi:MAG: hypothetical protein HY868_26695 [Chloroflexi bacterium]|nr:hypothetical protein [Chloroflexota bacterium]